MAAPLPTADDLGPRPTPQSNRQLAVVGNAGAAADALVAAGVTMNEIGTHIEQVRDEDDVRRLDVEHAQRARQIRQTAREARGLNAQTARQQADADLVALDQDILNRARSKTARRALEAMVTRRTGLERDSITDYAQRETTAAMDQAMTARIDTSLDEAQERWNNPEALEQSLNTVVAEISNRGRWRGVGPEQIANEVAAARSRVRSSVVEQMIQADDYDNALGYLEAHKDEIDHDHEVRLRGLVNGELQLQQADSDAAAVLSGAATSRSGAASSAPQPIAPGNIDVSTRPAVRNRDGSVSTVRTISIGTDEGEVLIPTVINGRVVSDEQAIAHYRRTGENLGTFRNAAEADAYAEALHRDEAARVGAGPRPAEQAQAAPYRSRTAAIVALGQSFVDQGYIVGENRHVGNRRFTASVHQTGEAHGEYMIDVNAANMPPGSMNIEARDPRARARFDQMALEAQRQGYRVLWNEHIYEPRGNGPGRLIGGNNTDSHRHRNHMHVEAPQALVGQNPESFRTPPPDGRRIDIESAYANIDAMPWTDARKRRARERVRQVAGENDLVRARDRQDADEEITRALTQITAGGGRLMNINQLPAGALSRASPNTVLQLQEMVRANNQPHAPEANSPLMASLINRAADDPNGFLREVDPEHYRGRITDGEVMQLHGMRNTITNRDGPQPSTVMGMINLVLPETGIVPTNARDQRQGRETEAQARGRIADAARSQIFSGVQQRLARNFPTGTQPTEQDVLDAVRAETATIMINGQQTRFYEYRQQHPGQEPGNFQITIPTRSLPYIDAVLRASGRPVNGQERIAEYMRHKSGYDAR